jgi:23S rRNA pseudouridine1911/1915/1917 synthase
MLFGGINMVPEILYEDKYLVVCVKPINVLSEENGMPEYLRQYYFNKNENDQIFCVHRLDRSVGGVMVYARTQSAASALSDIFAKRQSNKEYLAIVYGKPEHDSGIFTDLLFKDSRKNKSYTVTRMRKGVKSAKLEYNTIKSLECNGEICSLVLVHLHTGRSHQIRVQFASRKMPLLGDGKYGSKFDCDIALWGYRLSFIHPFSKESIDCFRNPPDRFPWSLFADKINT